MCVLASGVCQASHLQTSLLLQPLQSTLHVPGWADRSPTVITRGHTCESDVNAGDAPNFGGAAGANLGGGAARGAELLAGCEDAAGAAIGGAAAAAFLAASCIRHRLF